MREAKPGGFQPRVFPTFFGNGPDCVATLSGLFLVGALNRLRKRKGTNRENPRTIPEQIGKVPEKSGQCQKGQKRTKKDKNGRTSPDRETPPFDETPPRSAALDVVKRKNGFTKSLFSLFSRVFCPEHGPLVLLTICPEMSPFVLVCPDLSPFWASKRAKEDKRGQNGTFQDKLGNAPI